jgi:hypothetical protein
MVKMHIGDKWEIGVPAELGYEDGLVRMFEIKMLDCPDAHKKIRIGGAFGHLAAKISKRKKAPPPCLHLLVHNIKAPYITSENQVMDMNLQAKSAGEVLTVEAEAKRLDCTFQGPNKPKVGQRCKHDNKYFICLKPQEGATCKQPLYVQCKNANSQSNAGKKVLYFVTPTIARRKEKLKWLITTLKKLSLETTTIRLHWIVVEDSESQSADVAEMLEGTCESKYVGRYTHINIKKRDYNAASKSKGVQQRNLGAFASTVANILCIHNPTRAHAHAQCRS